MKTKPTLSEQIELYLSQELNEADKQAFEEQLAKDPTLKAEVENYQTLMKGITRASLKQLIQQRFKSYKLTQTLVKTAVILVTAAALGTAFYYGAKSLRDKTTGANELPTLNETGTPLWADADKNLPAEIYLLNPNKDTVIETKNGIILSIPANTFVGKNNEPANGEVKLDVREALDPATILKGGLSTTSDGKLLETGGMFCINAHSGDEQLKIAPGKNIGAQVPAEEIKPGMQLFDGERKPDGSINWVNPKQLEKFLVPVNILGLNFYPPSYLDSLSGMGYNIRDKKFTDSLYYSFASTLSSLYFGETYMGTFSDTLKEKDLITSDGKALFKANCASCHKASNAKLVGPGLAGVLNRIPGGDWKYKFVRNSNDLVKAGDAYTKKIFNENAGAVMTPFPGLSNQDIDAILAYCNSPVKTNGIDPAKIKTIWSEHFQNTLLSTREFEQRIPYIHRSCSNEILDLYVNNLDKNLWEIDSMASNLCPKPDVQKAFLDFASHKDGKVKGGGRHAELLMAYYEKKSKLCTEAINKTVQEFWDKQHKLDDIAGQKASEHSITDMNRAQSNFRNEYNLNLKEAYRQIGVDYDTAPKPKNYYTGTVTSLGWKNLDQYVAASTSNRTTLDYTDPDTGKKAVIKYEELNVKVENQSSYDRVLVYLVPDKLHSFMRLESNGSVFVEKLNELISYKLVAVGYKGDKVFFSVQEKAKPGTGTLSLNPGTENALNYLLSENGNFVGKVAQLREEMEFQKFLIRDEKRLSKLQKISELTARILPVVIPCQQHAESVARKPILARMK